MGWGNPTPLADVKRQHAERGRLARRAELAEAAVRRVQQLVDDEQVAVSVWLLRAALAEPWDCALCVSAYVDCRVHR